MVEQKQCSKCEIVKPIIEFNKRAASKDKHSVWCKSCAYLQMVKYMSDERSHILSVIASIYKPSACKRRGLWPAMTKQQMWEELIIYIQDMKEKFPGTNGRLCYYCYRPWTNSVSIGKEKEKNLNNFSIDRLDNTKTYTKENIIFCCAKCNDDKHSITLEMIDRIQEIRKERYGS